MKKYFLLIVFFVVNYGQTFSQKPIRVAVYNDEGGGDKGTVNFELSLNDDAIYSVRRVDAFDIRAGVLNEIDVLIQPGGSGSKQAKTLQESGRDSIRAFIARGGGFLGVCAGAYLSTSFYDWSLNILNALVIDREHWNRGGGDVILKFSEEGKKFFSYEFDTITVNYNQGPLLGPNVLDEPEPYSELATFQTEIAEKGAPRGVMIGTTAIAKGKYGKGKVVSISPHFEKNPEQRIFIRKAVNWLADREN